MTQQCQASFDGDMVPRYKLEELRAYAEMHHDRLVAAAKAQKHQADHQVTLHNNLLSNYVQIRRELRGAAARLAQQETAYAANLQELHNTIAVLKHQLDAPCGGGAPSEVRDVELLREMKALLAKREEELEASKARVGALESKVEVLRCVVEEMRTEVVQAFSTARKQQQAGVKAAEAATLQVPHAQVASDVPGDGVQLRQCCICTLELSKSLGVVCRHDGPHCLICSADQPH